ncbi:MAG: sulfotransferase domain-containing protein [Nitrosopumilaceae archaeon]|nr:sulfotransferase domain-containing protein [Nitrosopumilaceae archaeon]
MGIRKFIRTAKISRRYPYRWITAKRRRLPDFVIIGTQKSASTSLYQFIIDHPGVTAARIKEIDYFTINYEYGQGWYQSNFPIDDGKMTGEASINYMLYASAPSRMTSYLPDAKLLVVLRNPVDRAYSQYQMMFRKKLVTSTFEDALDTERANWGGRNGWLLRDDDPASFAINSYLAKGHYADQLDNWFGHYPREQFLIMSAEEMKNDINGTMEKVFGFLDLPFVRHDTYRNLNEWKYPPMSPETREMLVKHFRPHNVKLQQLLGREFGWDS